MDVFIVRPFGTKKVWQKDASGNTVSVDVDFDNVQQDLIMPALQKAGLKGGTTGLIFEAGSIHEDMFSFLLTADMVIADISIHNANVFYELGIRHALRDKQTVLLKCPGLDETPFDILGYRYVSYKRDNLSASIDDLSKTLTDTRHANKVDSPVFDKLHHLESQDAERFLLSPGDFDIDLQVTIAQGNASKLALMAEEISEFHWFVPGLRKIGEALYSLRCFEPARSVWEKITKHKPDDLQANDRLATIYQRLGESEIITNPEESKALFKRSDIAIEHLLKKYKTLWKRAESYSLKARNAKTQWLQSWKNLPVTERGEAALSSDYLAIALETYEQGFMECLNHYYSGINTLGLLLTTIALAEQYPDTWELRFDSREEALQKINALKERMSVIRHSVILSIDASKRTIDKSSDDYKWLRITEADFICLTETRPARVKLTYQNVLQVANTLNLDATVRQLLIYQQLGIVPANIKAALEALPGVSFGSAKTKDHTILFTGHMIDDPGRKDPRFPAEKELRVRAAIKDEISKEQQRIQGPVIGVAGRASGGDILFHEVCEELGIKTKLFLALPRDKFVKESVEFAGATWVDRFDRLYTTLSGQVLSQTKELSTWLQRKQDYGIWERNNLWMLNQALDNGGLHMTLIALWDGKGGDGPGGTAHMVIEAKERGAKAIRIDLGIL